MADYGRLFARIWADRDFTALESQAQQLYCLLISYSTRTHAGILPMTLKRWAKCSAGSTVETVKESLSALAAQGFVVIDWDTEEVLIRTYIRNDEVYKQPNVMQSALKSALQTESALLRWAIHDELERLPEHRYHEKTDEVSKTLIEGSIRPDSEPLAKGSRRVREGFAEPPGVGESYVGKENPPTPTPSPAPTPTTTEPFAETGTRPAKRFPSSASKTVVRQILGNAGYPKTIMDRLAVQAQKLYREGHPDSLIREALAEWDRRDNCTKPEFLPTVLGDLVKKSRAGPANNGRPEHKLRTIAALAAETRAAEEHQARKELL